MKNHLKSIAAPPTWIIPRQRGRLVLKPNPGGHPLSLSLPLGLLLRDRLKLVRTAYEAKKALHSHHLLVDGTRRQDIHFPVGLFDVVQVEGKAYRSVLDRKGRLVLISIAERENSLKLCGITGKTAAPGRKIQVRCHDGHTLLTEQTVAVGDSVLLSLPSSTIEKVFPRAPGAPILLTGGKHSGSIGIFKEMRGEEAICQLHERAIATKKEYLFVIGEKAPAIQVTAEVNAS